MRKKLLLGNWKMNKTPSEAKAFAEGCGEMVGYAISHGIDVGVAPTYVCLQTVVEHAPKGLIISAQNVSQYDHGAYTGEISIPMLKEIAEDTIGFIRRTLREMFGFVADDIRILYGGSVKPNNIAEYMEEPDIDGALVGGASLALDSYQGLIAGLVK